MRVFLVALVLSLSACDAAHEISNVDAGHDAGHDASDVDAFEPLITFHAVRAELSTCNCHHGCGPGIDGMFTIDVFNGTPVDRALMVTRVSVDSIGSPSGPFVAPGEGLLRLANARADGSVLLPAGVTTMITITVYLDVPMIDPGTDVVSIEAMLPGLDLGEIAHFASVPVSMAPGC